MSETSAPREDPYVRQVTSVDTLKALADPLRLAILTALMGDVRDPRDLRVMTVKELAAELGEPQTKLYRHVRQLEAAGLIGVASTRVVSGIVQQHYQACQVGLAFGPEILRDPVHGSEGAAMVTAVMNRYFDRFLARRSSKGDVSSGDVMLLATTGVSPETARLIRGKLKEIADMLKQPAPEDESAVTVEVLLGFFSPEQ
ncbi:MAG: ArsR/SmtB family transcription factor [Trebonia sp.]